jgi:transposase-like protein
MAKSSVIPSNEISANVPVAASSTETVARTVRRRHTAADKLRIVQQADGCAERGEIGSLLRRERLSSSQLSKWRQQFAKGGANGLVASQGGRKRKHDVKDLRIAELEKTVQRLEGRLDLASKLIDLQKKASALLGVALPTDEAP